MSLPLTVLPPPEVTAEGRAGLFCRSFSPVSGSPGALAVGPSWCRSMPRSSLE